MNGCLKTKQKEQDKIQAIEVRSEHINQNQKRKQRRKQKINYVKLQMCTVYFTRAARTPFRPQKQRLAALACEMLKPKPTLPI